MVVIGFEDRVSLRIRDAELKLIIKVCKRNQDIFESPSHFFRIAVIKELRNFDRKGKKRRVTKNGEQDFETDAG